MNDNLDHDAGNRYLVAVALQEAVGTRDIVSRYGRYKFLLHETGLFHEVEIYTFRTC